MSGLTDERVSLSLEVQLLQTGFLRLKIIILGYFCRNLLSHTVNKFDASPLVVFEDPNMSRKPVT